MKPVTLFLILSIFCLNIYSQEKIQTYSFNEEPLHKILKDIAKEHNLKLSYSPSLLKGYKVTKNIKASTPNQLIYVLLEEYPFEVRFSNNIYLIIPKKPSVITGKVVDKDSGTPLAFALVKSNTGNTVADQNGLFMLPPPKDTSIFEVSYLGYNQLSLVVPPRVNNLQITMEQNPMVLQEVILDANKVNDLSIPVSSFKLNPRQFSSLPALGETDVFKTLQLLPGISATNESTSGFNVRGSTPSQNLVLMDGFTLYHLDHFFGIFSTLNPNFIHSIDIYKGGFGAEYGGRVSSVVDVKSSPGNREKVTGGAGINFLSTNLYLDVPLGERVNILAGFRNSFTGIIESKLYTDFLSSIRQNFITSFDQPDLNALKLAPSLKFYDFNAKISARPSQKTTITGNLYVNEDNYRGVFQEGDDFSQFSVTDQADWSNAGLSLNWNQLIRNNQFLTLNFSSSEFNTSESLTTGFGVLQDIEFEDSLINANSIIDQTSFSVDNHVTDISVKIGHELTIAPESVLLSGVEVNSIQTNYHSDIHIVDIFSDSATQNFPDSLEQLASITSLYGSYTHRLGKLSATLGIRTNYYDATDEWYSEPRIHLGFQLNDQIQIKSAYSHHHQFINQTALSYLNSGRYYWVLSDDAAIPVSKSKHFILGALLSTDKWLFEAEYYQRKTSGVTFNRYIQINPGILSELSSEDRIAGENKSHGLDLLIKYKSKRYHAWLSYSLASSSQRFEFLNQGNYYPSDEDQLHEINLVNLVKLGQWELASTLIYGSGRPYTPQENVTSLSSFNPAFYEDTERINSLRFDSYKRIDVSAKYTFAMGPFESELGITLFNVFGFRNIKSRRYVRQFDFSEGFEETAFEEGVQIVPLDTYLLGFTPNFFLNVRF